MTSLVFLGDSITWGIVGPFQTGLTKGLDYPEIVTFWVEGAAEVVNEAVGGTTSTDWLPGGSWYPNASVHASPDAVLIVLLGTNDWFEDQLDGATFEANMSLIGTQALVDGYARVVFLTTLKPGGPEDPVTTAALESYRAALLGLCVANSQFVCADTFSTVLPQHYDPRDPVHPDQHGHGQLALGAYDAVSDLLVFP